MTKFHEGDAVIWPRGNNKKGTVLLGPLEATGGGNVRDLCNSPDTGGIHGHSYVIRLEDSGKVILVGEGVLELNEWVSCSGDHRGRSDGCGWERRSERD